MTPSPILEARNLNIAFGTDERRHNVVNDVRFQVPRGGAYGLIGESGCGKSTILRAIAGLNTDYEGEILFDGKVLGPRRTPEFRRQVQMVFQDPYASLHPRKIVEKTLAEPLAIHGLRDAGKRIDEVLSMVGLESGFRYRYPHQLSGGQRQRIAIARALITQPHTLLLDEPTSALDVSVQAEILNLLKRIRREQGLTYVLVSHDLAVIAHVCEMIGMMERGRIVEEMTPQDIRTGRAKEKYTREFLHASSAFANALEGQPRPGLAATPEQSPG
nr:ABC transporter ATP-binding protein [Mesorhizobium shangrilense]